MSIILRTNKIPKINNNRKTFILSNNNNNIHIIKRKEIEKEKKITLVYHNNFKKFSEFNISSNICLKDIFDTISKQRSICPCKLKLYNSNKEFLSEFHENPEKIISQFSNLIVSYNDENKCYCNYSNFQLINILNSKIEEYENKIKELETNIGKKENEIKNLKNENESLNKKLMETPEWKNLFSMQNEINELKDKKSKEINQIQENYKKEIEKNVEKINKLNNENIKLKEANEKNSKYINDLQKNHTNEIKKLCKEKDEIENKLNKEKEDLIKSKTELNKEISNIKEEHKNEINQLNSKNKELNNEKINNQKKYEENINDLKKNQKEEKEKYEKEQKQFHSQEIKKLENEYNQKIDKINKENIELKKEGELLANVDPGNFMIYKKIGCIKNLNSNSNALEIDPENRIKLNGNAPNVIFEEFHDSIINIKSVKETDKGWELKMNNRGIDNYNKFKKESVIRIGVIGNSNKGKSFILSKLSKIKLPSGASIRTEGLSVKYPEIKDNPNRKIVLLDSAGLETPVLVNEIEDLKKDEIENIKNSHISENNSEQESDKYENENENENYVINNNKKCDLNENKNEQLFKEKSREKIMTELFLQNYIMHNSDILILVVGILTYSEQKLINRIKKEMKNQKIDKPLYIIHNLVLYDTVDKVENHIKNVLLKCATFQLEKREKIQINNNNLNGVHYYEKNSKPPIYHLILANDISEAGEYYNPYTIRFIENQFQFLTDLKSFDIIETLKKRFVDVSKDYFERPISEKEFIDNEDMISTKIMKLKEYENKINKIELKSCLIDELGFSNFKGNGFIPKYNYFQNGDKICVRIEVPGNYNLTCGGLKYSGEYTIIPIQGEKKKDQIPTKTEDNIYTTREFGKFEVNIYLQTEKYKLENISIEPKTSNGVAVYEFPLIKEKIENVNSSFSGL